MPRIVSFLPAGTEIAYAVGAGGQLVGRSHECDYPTDALRLPVVSRPTLDLDGLTSGEIDAAVAARVRAGESLYVVDEYLLRDLAADVILTQDLCHVCAPSGNELTRVLRTLPGSPNVVWLTPHTLAEIDDNIRDVGEAVGRTAEAAAVIARGRERIERVSRAVAGARRPRVAFLEWTDPLFRAGHWVPEMISLAGGDDRLGRGGADSTRMSWSDVVESQPEFVIVAPCGYGLAQAAALARTIPRIDGATVVAVDANAYFARPGPRVAEGIELLAHLLHADRCLWPHAHRPWEVCEAPAGVAGA
jgi:iron complex transport system substrate-binding protein